MGEKEKGPARRSGEGSESAPGNKGTAREGGAWGGGDRGKVEAGRDFWDRPEAEVASQEEGDAEPHDR